MAVKHQKKSLSATSRNDSKNQPRNNFVLTLGDPDKDFDGLIHERNRLAIVSALAVNSSLTFSDLKSMLTLSDGNLSVHARKLEESNYILCKKRFINRKPQTEYRLTGKGQKALKNYLSHMEALIDSVNKQ